MRGWVHATEIKRLEELICKPRKNSLLIGRLHSKPFQDSFKQV